MESDRRGKKMKKLMKSIYEAIGQTPMLELSRITKHYGVEGRILAKLEFLNPGYSKKDRPALEMIQVAEENGDLKPGQTVVELTSGNTGTGLSIVCQAKGYPFVAVMSEGNSEERARMMRALGAEVVLVPQCEGSIKGKVTGEDLKKVEQRAQELVKERNAFRADQFRLDASYTTHFRTGEEMWEQSNGEIDVFLDIVGSGGTFEGCSEVLKAHNPNIKSYLVEPENAAVYAKHQIKNDGQHRVQGCGYAMADLPKVNVKNIDGLVQVNDDETLQMTRDLARYEGCFVGISSGANVAAAIKLLKGEEKGKTIVLTLNDSGLKYLSTDLFD